MRSHTAWLLLAFGGVAGCAGDSPRADDASATLAEGTAVLRGTVTSDGHPASARVTLRRVADDARERDWGEVREDVLKGRHLVPPVDTIDANGAYAFTGLAPGIFRVTARDESGATATAEVTIAAPGQRVAADLRLHPPAGDRVVRGRVIDAGSGPVRGFVYAAADGRMDPWASPQIAKTAPDGSFALEGLADESHSLAVLLPGRLLLETGPLAAGPDGSTEIDLARHLRPLTVRVVSDGGAPVAGADVVWTSSDGPDALAMASTDATGAAELHVTHHKGSLTVEASGFPRAKTTVDEASADFEVRLQRCADVSVRVTARDGGAPVADVPVWWTSFGGSRRGGPARTDADGVARLGAIRPGAAMVFVASERWVSVGLEKGGPRTGFGGMGRLGSSASSPPLAGVFEIPRSGSPRFDLVAEPALVVTGRVLDEHGAPVAGALVSAPPPGWFPWPHVWHDPWAVTATGDDGEFTLDGVFPRGGQVLRVSTSDHCTVDTALPAAGARAELRLVASAAPLVVVREKGTGRPVAGAMVDPHIDEIPAGVHFDAWRHWTDAGGEVRVGPLPIGKWTIHVECADHLEPPEVVLDEARLRDASPVVVEIDRGLAVSGRVHLPDGSPARRGTVYVAPPGAMSKSGTDIAADGSFTRRGLEAGEYEVEARVDDGSRELKGIAIVAAGAAPIDVRLWEDAKPAGAERGGTAPRSRCIVRVVDSSGRTVDSGSYEVGNAWSSTGGGFSGGEIELMSGWDADKGTTLELFDLRDASDLPCGVGAAVVTLPNPLPARHEVRLRPEKPIRGYVRDADGRPVAGAHMTAHRLKVPRMRVPSFHGDGQGEKHGDATSTADGAFEILGLGDFDYALGTEPPIEFIAPDATNAHGGSSAVEIVVKSGIRPRVRALGPTGEPLRGATVEVCDSDAMGFDGAYSAVTGADGWASLPAMSSERRFDLLILPPDGSDLLSGQENPWVPKAETTVTLAKNGTASGTIVDADGRPVPGATYWVFYPSEGNTIIAPGPESADESGRFKLRRLRDDGALVAAGDFPSHQWSMPGWPSLDEEELVRSLATRITPGMNDVRVAIAKDRWLEVGLTGPAEATFDESTSTLVSADGKTSHRCTALDDGRRLVFTGLSPDRQYTLFARSPSNGLVAFAERLRPGERATANWAPGAELTGRVVLPGSAEIRDTQVRVEFGRSFITTKARPDGSFRIGALPPRAVKVSVYASEADGNWFEWFDGMPGGPPLTLSPKRQPIPATPR